MDGKFYFTRRGVTKLHEKIEKLEEKLADLHSQFTHLVGHYGDLSDDNPIFDSFNSDARGLTRVIVGMHNVLDSAILVEPPTNFERASIGTKVRILCDGEEMTWHVVGFGESDPDRNMLAYNTPLASFIMGKRKDEIISGIIAGRRVEIRIIEIMEGCS